jgi:glycogen debranching enzyme
MGQRISVGPPLITINQGNMFMVTLENGEITPDSELGFFAQDTRLVSLYQIRIEQSPWDLATSSALTYYGARYCLVSPQVQTHSGTIHLRDLALTVERSVGEGVHEDLDIVNYSNRHLSFNFELRLESDFADIFEVKEHRLVPRGALETDWNAAQCELTTKYQNRDFQRGLIWRIFCKHGRPHYANGNFIFEVDLPPSGQWHTCSLLIPVIQGKPSPVRHRCNEASHGDTEMDRLQQKWQQGTTHLCTPNTVVQQTYDQSIRDIGALRLYEHDISDDLWMPAAGVPWFVTVFGRDSLIVSLQNMLINCPLANGTLKRLTEFQAKERDDFRDAQPGKILHEIRFGELAHFKLIPHAPYYGTADATILFPILLSETYRWTGREEILREFRDPVLRCLEWIDHYGDLDGDGFQEYKTLSPQGYHNLSWKDASDAVVYPDGSQVRQPIATCELQGYVYDAKLRLAEIFEALGDSSAAKDLRDQAETLKRRFNEAFWMPDEAFYAFALDPDKKQVKTIASNPGHLLWSGIVPQERAQSVIQRLLQPDMFSGWGIRTLSSANPAYNPHEYQRGSVWPHDNAIIAAGAKRYGLWRETNQIANAIFDAASAFQAYRLPELFAGLQRTEGSFPVQYIGANTPQAWAAGSIFMLLRAICGIRADLPRNELSLNPTLPDWLPELILTNLKVGEHRMAIRFAGNGTDSRFEVLENPGAIRVNAARRRAA